MKKLKRIDIKSFDGLCPDNHQRAKLAKGLNDIMEYLEKLNKKINKIEILKNNKEENNK